MTLEERLTALENETLDEHAARVARNTERKRAAAAASGPGMNERTQHAKRLRAVKRQADEIALLATHIRALESVSKSHPHFARDVERGWTPNNGIDPKLHEALRAAGTTSLDSTRPGGVTPGLRKAQRELAALKTEQAALAQEIAAYEKRWPA
jgi:hypothetical protein